jgi:hypothetical protein
LPESIIDGDGADVLAFVGAVCVALSVAPLVLRDYRAKIAGRLSDWHAPTLRRFPWLQGPRRLREWWFSEAGWRRFVVGMSVGLVMVGVLILTNPQPA